VAVTCRVLQISRSGFYEWATRPPSARDVADAHLLDTIVEIHADSRQTYGVRRIHAELRLGLGIAVGRQRVERLMRLHGIQGVHRRRWRGHRGRDAAVFADLVQREFRADAPDRLWVTDITQHRTSEGWVYAAAVIDAHTRRCVGWSIADHLRTELVVDALDMARWRRKPAGTVVHADRGTQYTSWLFGQRLRDAGLMGSMGKVACAYDNSLMEMLLSVSSGHRCRFENAKEVTGVVPLQAAHGLALGLALGDTAGDVVLGRLVVLCAGQDRCVQRPVELTITAA
jgi:putative transposase